MSGPTLQLLAALIGAAGSSGGAPSGATLNPFDKHADITLSGGNLSWAKTTTGAWRGVRATTHKTTGKRYWEAKFTAGTNDGFNMGFVLLASVLTNFAGGTANTIGLVGGGGGGRQVYSGGSLITTGGSAITANTFVGVAVDIDAGKAWFRSSNASGWIGGGDPSLGTTPSCTFTPGLDLYPYVSGYYNNITGDVNFGGSAFNMTAPVGYVSWDASAEATYSDPYWPQTVLLVAFTGADGATTCSDTRGRHTSFTFNGNAQIDTSDGDFPDGALMLDGVSDHVYVNDSLSDFVIPASGSVTIEVWHEPRSFTQFRSFCGNYAGGGGGWRFGIESGGGALNFRNGDGGANVHSRTVSGGVPANTRSHAAFVRDGSLGTSRMFHNGVKAGADITSWNIALGLANILAIGTTSSTYPNDDEYDGWISYIRITHAVRYWADFTPPTVPYPTV